MCRLFYWYPFFMGGFGWFWMIIGLILIVGLIAILLSRKFNFGCMMHDTEHSHSKHEEDPIKILKRMYAKGEISEEEYEKRRKNIEK